jgi:hypothetical protein
MENTIKILLTLFIAIILFCLFCLFPCFVLYTNPSNNTVETDFNDYLKLDDTPPAESIEQDDMQTPLV